MTCTCFREARCCRRPGPRCKGAPSPEGEARRTSAIAFVCRSWGEGGGGKEGGYEARAGGLIRKVPEPGAGVVYTNGTVVSGGRYGGQLDAIHIGIVLRVEPVLLSIEGNTVISAFDRNGFVQALKEVVLKRVFCFISR